MVRMSHRCLISLFSDKELYKILTPSHNSSWFEMCDSFRRTYTENIAKGRFTRYDDPCHEDFSWAAKRDFNHSKMLLHLNQTNSLLQIYFMEVLKPQ